MSATANARQLERLDELRRQGDSGCPSTYHGQHIVAAFERYLTSGRAEDITAALHEYLHTQGGYKAHTELKVFRRVYEDPVDLLRARHESGSGPSRYGPVKVYRDGMTHLEVGDRLAELVSKHRSMVFERSERNRAAAEIATARELAARHGYRLVALDEPAA